MKKSKPLTAHLSLMEQIKFDDKGLVPAIAQDASSKEILMMAYMNHDSLAKTIETGYATYWSRSRQELWKKGATSGNVQKVQRILFDCDGDTLLLIINQTGPACHTGERTCFHRELATTS